MDKRTRVAKMGPARTVVMDTPPKMTAIMDRVSAQCYESDLVPAELGITRMPTGPEEEVVSSDKTSLFVRRPSAKEVKRAQNVSPSATYVQPANAASQLATRMVFAEGNVEPINPPVIGTENALSRNGLPLPPPGRGENKKRANTESVRRLERLLKPVILVAVLAVSAVVVLSQRSERIADAAGATQSAVAREGTESAVSEPLLEEEGARVEAQVKKTLAPTDPVGGETRALGIEEKQPATKSYARKVNATLESKAASLLISGHRREALNHYRKLAALPNASSGVKAMLIVLEQKVESP